MQKNESCLLHIEKQVSIYSLKKGMEIPVGYIINEGTKQKMEIFLTYDCYEETGYHCSVGKGIIENEWEICYCLISIFFFKTWFIKNSPVVNAILMHEFGHIVNGDHKKCFSAKASDDIRIENIRRGIVDSRELKADYFAALQVGAKHYKRALNVMKIERGIRNDIGAPIAILEIENRIKYIEDTFQV